MKKIISIIGIQQVKECYELEEEYKVVRANLKKYQKSLQDIKSKASAFYQNLAKSNRTLQNLHKEKCFKEIKKTTQLDYFTIHGCKVFKKIADYTAKPINTYQRILSNISEAQKKVEKCIIQTRKNFKEHSEAHQEVVRDYAKQCFPETDTILFKLGFVSPEKVVKKEDKYKESSLIQQSKIYIGIMQEEIIFMEKLKEQCLNIGKSFYSQVKDQWIEAFDKMIVDLEQFVVDENEVADFVPAGGGQNSFRSARSDRERDQQVQEC